MESYKHRQYQENRVMKRIAVSTLLVGSLAALFPQTTRGDINLSFAPSAPTVSIGDTVDVDVVISGLGVGQADSVSAFDIDVSFADALLSYDGVVFGPAAGFDLDIFDLGGNITSDFLSPGSVNLFELSFDGIADLNDLQASSFVLTTLTFEGLVPGFSPLSISIHDLVDAYGGSLPATVTDGGITVVPAPGAALLGLIGLVGVALFKRQVG